MEHTPGPWKAIHLDIVDGWQAGEHLVAHAYGANDGKQGDPVANARLIAAAPNLLEALERIARNLRASQRDGMTPAAIGSMAEVATVAIEAAK